MTARNVRSYQSKGLIPPPTRQGRRSVYDHRHVERLEAIRRAREQGASLQWVMSLLKGADPLHAIASSLHSPTGSDPAGTAAVERRTPTLPAGLGDLPGAERLELSLKGLHDEGIDTTLALSLGVQAAQLAAHLVQELESTADTRQRASLTRWVALVVEVSLGAGPASP